MAETKEANLYELLLEAGKAITSEIELEKLVQRVTDIGTQMSGAKFGAFFYNVINQKGEAYVLYTISGVAREAFSKFPMPRNTAIFHPTFAGTHTVRYDDVTAQPHYGKSDPHFGMPKGHLPVRSYLAVPVISPVTQEVIGGLFFGHPSAGVFTERSEKLVEGIAAQAAIAMGNARLFEEKKHIEKKLEEQKDQYRSIFQSTTDAMLIFSEERRVIEANLAATELFAYSLDELKEKSSDHLLENAQQVYNAAESIARSGRRYQGIGAVQTKLGERVEVRLTATSYQNHGEQHLLLVLKQIDVQRQIEEALVKSEAFTQTITDVSPVVLWMTNEKAEAIYMNNTWMEMVGGRLDEHLGNGWLNGIVEEDRERAGKQFMDAFTERKVFTQDFRIRRRDGAILWCSTYGSPYYLPDGSFGGFAGSLTDITERKATEEKLSSQNILINTITNNTLQALFLMDDKQRCTYMNPAAEKMTGFTVAEVQEKPLHYYVHHTHPDGRHFPIEECPIDRALPTRMQTTGEEIFIRKNGEFFPVAFVASPIVENGVPKGTVIEVRETTEEKKIQEELRNKEKQALETLEQKVKERTSELEKINYELIQFTSVASHDLKEPVRKVAIFAQRSKELTKEVRNDQYHQYMDSIIRTTKRMATLIDDLLSFARLSQTNIAVQKVDLNGVLQHILDDLQIAIAEKEAQVIVEPLPVVEGIELQLGQVFQNLISNSLKFSAPSRKPVIKISCENENGFYNIDYSDNGIGFDNSLASKIFNIFQRLHPKDNYEGTGIGLAIVKKIIDQHNGTIKATSKTDKGTRFEIRLPVVSNSNGQEVIVGD